MSVDLGERVKRAARLEPDWNELREQRVLGRITEARRRSRSHGRRRARLLVAAAAVALIAGGGTLLVREAMAPGEQVATGGEASPAHLDFVDGSTALLSEDAHVRVDSQGTDGVWLTQQGGTVTYEVTHDPDRPFVVRAADVTVRVIGTRFVVAMDPGYVEVRVERGRVSVDGPEQHAVLGRGERVRIAASAPRASPEDPGGRPVEAAVEEAPRRDAPEGTAPAPSVTPSGERPVRRPSPEPATPPASMDDMLAQADVARRAGKAGEAGAILRRALAAHPDHDQSAAAWFTLGRVERNAGHPGEAAQAFAAARRAAPRGPLAEDALAEEASAWKVAGDAARARAAAASYIEEYPGGLHVPRMRALAE